MDPKLKVYLDERFNAVDERFNAVDERFDVVDERFNAVDEGFNAVDERFESIETRMVTKGDLENLENSLSEQMQSVSNTATKILNKLEDRMEALDEIVSDTGLGGRVHKLEIEVKEIKTVVA